MPPISVQMGYRNYFEGTMKPWTRAQMLGVEQHRYDDKAKNGINLIRWRIRWIEYHRGKPNDARADRNDD